MCTIQSVQGSLQVCRAVPAGEVKVPPGAPSGIARATPTEPRCCPGRQGHATGGHAHAALPRAPRTQGHGRLRTQVHSESNCSRSPDGEVVAEYLCNTRLESRWLMDEARHRASRHFCGHVGDPPLASHWGITRICGSSLIAA